jgi:hypothetical protein
MSVILMVCMPGIALIICDSRKIRANALAITSTLAASPMAAARRFIRPRMSTSSSRARGRTSIRNAVTPMSARRPTNENVRARELLIEEAASDSSPFSLVVDDAVVALLPAMLSLEAPT